jgi:hypothetical protein
VLDSLFRENLTHSDALLGHTVKSDRSYPIFIGSPRYKFQSSAILAQISRLLFDDIWWRACVVESTWSSCFDPGKEVSSRRYSSSHGALLGSSTLPDSK